MQRKAPAPAARRFSMMRADTSSAVTSSPAPTSRSPIGLATTQANWRYARAADFSDGPAMPGAIVKPCAAISGRKASCIAPSCAAVQGPAMTRWAARVSSVSGREAMGSRGNKGSHAIIVA